MKNGLLILLLSSSAVLADDVSFSERRAVPGGSSVTVTSAPARPVRFVVERKVAEGQELFARSPFYVNGERLDYEHGDTPGNPDAKGLALQRIETRAITLRKGDVVVTVGKNGGPAWKMSEKTLKDGWITFCELEQDGRERLADFGGSAFKPGLFHAQVANLFGERCKVKVEIRVTDFFQRDLVREVREVELGGDWSEDFRFALGSADVYRAAIYVDFPCGKVARRLFTLDHNRTEGYHRYVDLDKVKWDACWTTDDRTALTRGWRPEPPTDAQWRKVGLPHRKANDQGKEVLQRWYRLRFATPAHAAGERVVLYVERSGTGAGVAINGKNVFRMPVEHQGMPFEVDLTDDLKDGENELVVFCQGPTANLREADLAKGTKSHSYQDRLGEPRPSGDKGAFLGVRFEIRPTVAIPEPRIITRYREKTIEVRTASFPAGYTVSHRVLRKGVEVVPPFTGRTVWAKPILWGPKRPFSRATDGRDDQFPLLELESTLKDASGKVVDVRSTRFGFREFEADGMDFKVNGVSVRGIGRAMHQSYARYLPNHQAELDYLERFRWYGNVFARHAKESASFYEVCDELGIISSMTSWCSSYGKHEAPRYHNPEYWRVKAEDETYMLRCYPNFASVYTWYLSNEYGMAHTPDAQRKMEPVLAALRKEDPTRFLECGCDLDLGGRTDCVSTHYPIHRTLADRDTYLPEGFFMRPLDGAQFTPLCRMPFGQQKRVCNVRGESMIVWGRKPISAHETGWSVFLYYPFGPTMIWGDRALSSPGMCEFMHVAHNRAYYEGHRDANFYEITTWRAMSRDDTDFAAPPFETILLQRYHAFRTGAKVRFDADVFHDVLADEDVSFAWRLVRKTDGRTVAKGGKTERIAFCGMMRDEIAFVAPAPGAYALFFEASCASSGKVAYQRDITVAPAADDFRVPEGARLVEAGDALDASVLDVAKAGGTVVILDRADYPAFLPFAPVPNGKFASKLFTFHPDHPALAGLSEGDLEYWYPKHVIATNSYEKPKCGSVRTLLEGGGSKQGLIYAYALEVPCGKGALVFTTLPLDAATCRVNPLAAQLRDRLLAYRAKNADGKLGVVGDKETLKWFRERGVACEAVKGGKTDVYRALWVDAAANGPDVVAGFKGTVFAENPSEAWGVKGCGKPSDRYAGRAVLVEDRRDPILAGLNNQDFFKRGQVRDEATASGLLDPKLSKGDLAAVEVCGAKPLLFPRYLARRDNVVFTTLKREERVALTMLANAGVAVKLPKRIVRTSAPKQKKTVDVYDAKNKFDKAASSRYCMKGADAMCLGKQKEAIEWFEKAVAADPHNLWAYQSAAETLLYDGDYKGAEKWCERSLEVDENQPPVMEMLKTIRGILARERNQRK